MVGAAYGPASLPEEWVKQVEMPDVIEILAKDLAMLIEEAVDPKTLSTRYPGW